MGAAVDRLISLSQVKAHTRHTPSGKIVQVRDYQNKVLKVRLAHGKAPYGGEEVRAWVDDEPVGRLSWEVAPGEPYHGRIITVNVYKEYQRLGIASKLYDYAKSIEPAVHHSDIQSADGKAWAHAVGGN